MQYPSFDSRTVKVKTVPMGDLLAPTPASSTTGQAAPPLDYYGRIQAAFTKIKLDFAGRLSAIEAANFEREEAATLVLNQYRGQEASARLELNKVGEGHDQAAIDRVGNDLKRALLDQALAKVKVKEAALESEKARYQHFENLWRALDNANQGQQPGLGFDYQPEKADEIKLTIRAARDKANDSAEEVRTRRQELLVAEENYGRMKRALIRQPVLVGEFQ